MAYLIVSLAIITAIKHAHLSRAFVATIAALALSIAAPASSADDDEAPFAEAKIFFELNDTDGDLGIHALIDGEPWKKLEIEDPKERRMLLVYVTGRLRRQGLTEIFFESAEPPFDELDPVEFFKRFPPGTYEVEGMTVNGQELESEVELTHVMPAPAAPTINGKGLATQCDPDDPGYNAPVVTSPIKIEWPAVTMSHPDAAGAGAAVQPPVPVTIKNYEVVVEVELEVNGEEFASVLHVVLPPGERSVTIPPEFIGQGDTFKYEVLTREESDNQTAVENCFQL